MATNKSLKQAVLNKDDEFYTMREDIESILKQYGHIIRGKKIYLPADSPNSSIFKVLQERKKELDISLVNTWDDFNNHPLLWEEADIIITNPPFSRYRDFYDLIKQYRKKYIIVGPKLSITYKTIEEDLCRDLYRAIQPCRRFERPDGTIYYMGTSTYWWTNIEEIDSRIDINEKIAQKDGEAIVDDRGTIVYNRLNEVPRLASNTTIAVPIDFALYRHDEWEILSTYRPVHEGRKLFRRVLIRRKERPI